VVVKKNCFCVFSILIVGKEAVCPDGLFVPAVFRESDFYLNSLKCDLFTLTVLLGLVRLTVPRVLIRVFLVRPRVLVQLDLQFFRLS
jgi:hypothetical protein